MKKQHLAKRKAAETAASMTMDELHNCCVAGAGRIAREFQATYRKIKDDLPYIAEMRSRFTARQRGQANIKNCRTWKEYVRQYLNRSESLIRHSLAAYRKAGLVPETSGTIIYPLGAGTRVPLILKETVTTEHFNKPPVRWLNDPDKPREEFINTEHLEPPEPPRKFFVPYVEHVEVAEPIEETEIVLHTKPVISAEPQELTQPRSDHFPESPIVIERVQEANELRQWIANECPNTHPVKVRVSDKVSDAWFYIELATYSPEEARAACAAVEELRVARQYDEQGFYKKSLQRLSKTRR